MESLKWLPMEINYREKLMKFSSKPLTRDRWDDFFPFLVNELLVADTGLYFGVKLGTARLTEPMSANPAQMECQFSASANLYPNPRTVWIKTGLAGSLSIFCLIFPI